jgi:anti-sigma B factor antagonist
VTTPLTIRASQHPDGSTVLTAVGEIDQSNVDALNKALTNATAQSEPARVTVDLTAVEYLDSAALAVLFPYAERIRIVATPLLGPVLTISGMAELITIDGI